MRVGMANCKGCNDAGDPAQLMKVGSFQANPFGLFDMGGGVDQWVADSWHKNYQGAPADGSAWVDEDSFARVIRSGSWKNDASYVRSASRDHYDARVRYPTHGFRVALSL
jgi:formylglycine-generating enzyme required for sulfatase activity